MLSDKSRIKIIIADDSKEFVEGLLVLFSKSLKYEVIDIFTNGKDLWESPRIFEADLLLIDIKMPVIDGIEVARRINYEHYSIYMIAITMYIDKVYLSDIVSVGFKAFVHKPKVGSQLLDIIDQVLNDKYVFPKDLKIK